jgi:NAD(P)H-nitrite reductase large subunit
MRFSRSQGAESAVSFLVARFERCWCTGVDRELVVAAIRREQCRTVAEVRRASGACFGCQTCRPEIEELLAEMIRLAESPTGAFEIPPADGPPPADPPVPPARQAG